MDFIPDFFHGPNDFEDRRRLIDFLSRPQTFSYRFSAHFHPYVAQLIKKLIEGDGSLSALQAADTENTPETLPNGKPRPTLYEEIFTGSRYNPNLELVPNPEGSPHPVKELDFGSGGAYAVYNWELFYHVPLAIAVDLSRNQRYDEAQQWFHCIFDPTDDSAEPSPQRFWKVKPFKTTDVEMIENILIDLASAEPSEARDRTISSIAAWKDAPFRPHVVARYRPSAYMLKTVMAYLDNLLAWGDSLLSQDTGETVNEAAQLYVLAANILGPRPQPVPDTDVPLAPTTYDSLRDDLDAFSNAIRDVEADIAHDATPYPNEAGDDERLAAITSLGNALYFCVPRNDKLLGYWDTIADRLFKIRNSLNIQGVFRQLALFEPPLDPALLARAAAAGLDVAAIVSGVNQPLPLVRFQVLVQKAVEICQEVKSMGNNLLAAIEKEDNEAFAILRARHERQILGLAENVKYAQWQEAIKAREGLDTSLANAVQRYTYYERLLGKRGADIDIPDLDASVLDGLQTLNFKAEEPVMRPRDIAVDIAPGGPGTVGSLSSGLLGAADITGGKKISSNEFSELNLLEEARLLQEVAANFDITGSGVSLIPQFDAAAMPIGVGVSTGFGGVQLSKMFTMMASYTRILADERSYKANRAAKIGSYARREQEWAFQSNLAAGEINQIFKQLRAAEIREFVAEREWQNHKTQIRNAEEIEQFLTDERTGKKANQAFYAWMKREVKGLYGQCFQFAFDVAKKAERALQHELGNPELSYLQFGYLAGKEGLLAGEKLYFDIKRMEMAYHDLNQREYELTRHVSILQVDPLALLELRATGRCTVELPEALFDMDGPGHYFRRIKTVAVSIPCVTGPYAGVNCTLTLLKSTIRKTPILRDGLYARQNAEDVRFDDYYGSMQSIVTSSAQNDSGLFETNLRDERYLPFENSGVISEWKLELPANPSIGEPCQFDYNTISDVILHIRYTAREGGSSLRTNAVENLATTIEAAQAAGSVRLFSVRHEFPSEWAAFQGQTPAANQRFELALNLREEHYPFWSQGRLERVTRVDLYARSTSDSLVVFDKADRNDATGDTLVPALGNLLGRTLTNVGLPSSPVGEVKFYFEDREISDLWVAVTWGSDS